MTGSGRVRTPPALLLAAVLLAVVGLAALGFGVASVYQVRASRPIVGIGAAVVMLGYGVALMAIARGVLRGRRWSRGPGIAAMFIQLPIAWSFRAGETWWFALLLGTVSIVVVGCLLLPSATAVFVPESDRTPERS